MTAGTVFQRTRGPLRTWFWAIFFLGRHKKGISALQLQRDTGLGSYQTAWTMLHKLRSALRPRPAHRLTGAVEADETYVGGYRPGLRGRGVGKTGVAVAVENCGDMAGATRLAVVPHTSTQELTSWAGHGSDRRSDRSRAAIPLRGRMPLWSCLCSPLNESSPEPTGPRSGGTRGCWR